MTDEQRELFRLCGLRILENRLLGRKVTPQALEDARKWAAYQPLGRPLTPGAPGEPS